MSELGIYEGCYAVLADGSFTGRIEQDVPYFKKIWKEKDANRWWNADGSVYHQNQKGGAMMRVLTPAEALKPQITNDQIQIEPKISATIPPHVLTAAMDAGIKAKPVYEQFVNAILEAGFQAQYGIEFVGRSEQPEVDINALCEEISASLPTPKGFLERPEASQQSIRNVAERVIAYMADKRIPKNESENRIQDSEKPKGGPSDIRSVIVDVLRDDPQVRDITSLASASVEAINKASGLCVDEGCPHHGEPHVCVDARPPTFSIAPDLIAIALDEAHLKSQNSGISTRSFQIKAISDLITTEVAKYGPKGMHNPHIPSVEIIDEAIKAAVREWRENHDPGESHATMNAPPIALIAKKVHAVICNDAGEDIVRLVAPEGWYLFSCEHSGYGSGQYQVEFARLNSPTAPAFTISGKANNLIDAWAAAQNAVMVEEELP